MKTRFVLLITALTLLSCTLFGPQQSVTLTQVAGTATVTRIQTPAPSQTAETVAPGKDPTPIAEPNPNLNAFSVDLSRPFFGMPLAGWEPAANPNPAAILPIALQALANPAVIEGLTAEQKAQLALAAFTVLPTQEEQFADIRFQVADQAGQPYFLTTDAAFHALHINFDELLKGLERTHFRAQMIDLTQALLDKAMAYRQDALGTSIEADADLAAAYLAVAMTLFDPSFQIPDELQEKVEMQVGQIMRGAGREPSVLMPEFEDDYGAYKPVGHYATHPDLEAYFRGMTWLGRVAFQFKNEDRPDLKPSRAPLIVTLALREARTAQGTPAADLWGQLHETLTFLIGPSDDPGPLELSSLMDTIYGPGLSISALVDDTRWQEFLARVDGLPAPQINSTFATSTQVLESSRDWRLMGQRFTLDGMILQNMVFDKVGTQDKPRKLPSGLDVMAAFGSPAALAALEQAGETGYANYMTQLEKMQSAVLAQPEEEWLARFSTGWLYALISQVSIKGGAYAYPPFMRTPAWQAKELNSALGSWAELKHDTVLYTKMPEFMGGGGPPSSGPAPAYIEPNPDVFYRLGYIAQNLAEGLMVRGYDRSKASDMENGILPVDRQIWSMRSLGERFTKLGDIAVLELQGQAPDVSARELITGCLGMLECDEETLPDPKPVPVVAAVAGAENERTRSGCGRRGPHLCGGAAGWPAVRGAGWGFLVFRVHPAALKPPDR
jgi:hypothetical protein